MKKIFFILLFCIILYFQICVASKTFLDPAQKSLYYGTGRLVLRANHTQSDCSKYKECDSCTDRNDCVWCSQDSYCKTGSFSGGDCAGWMYGQCVNDGLALLVGVGIILALLILIILAIIFCCIFCRRSAASYEVMDDEPASSAPSAAHPITDQHRQDMEAKYGLSSPSSQRTEIDT